MAEGARLETPTAPETIGPHLIVSFSITTAESEAGEEPIKPDPTR